MAARRQFVGRKGRKLGFQPFADGVPECGDALLNFTKGRLAAPSVRAPLHHTLNEIGLLIRETVNVDVHGEFDQEFFPVIGARTPSEFPGVSMFPLLFA